MPPSSRSTTKESSHSLLVMVLDCSTCPWGERDLRRAASDKARLAAGKTSVGPATIEDVLTSVQAFATAYGSLERHSGLMVIGVAGNETAVVFPRPQYLARYFGSPETTAPYDLRRMRADLWDGVAELMHRSSRQLSAAVSHYTSTNNHSSDNHNNNNTSTNQEPQEPQASSSSQPPPQPTLAAAHAASTSAAMAAAFSLALCGINRFLVATRTGVGVSAVQTDQFLASSGNDGGVLAMMGDSNKSGSSNRHNNHKKANAWSPRVLLVQASEDRSRDYNAFMNCAFAAVKHNIVVDGCFIPSGGGSSSSTTTSSSSSAFLEQACDLSGGVFLAPSGPAQVGGALTEVLLSVFLAPRSCRHSMNLPAINKVDFRARCFETGQIVDMAFVCNQCLSIFKKRPKDLCPTCQAEIKGSSNNNKKQRIDAMP